MAAALAGFVLKQLASLAVDKASLLWNLKSDILKLQNTVSSIQAVLLDAEGQSGKNHQVQLWLQRLEAVLYDAEDLLDDFSTEVLRRKQMDGNVVANEVSLFCSESNQVAYGLEIANQIKLIQSKLEEIDQDRNQFYFQTFPVSDDKEWRETYSSIPDVVVGREEDKRKIIDMLLLSGYKEKVVVVPIIGIGGLGKTTLAQLIYNDDIIKTHFVCKVWVCVAENFDPKFLVKRILESITKKKVGDLALDTLKDLLHEQIKNKHILLVLDDVWNDDRGKWDRFKNLFASSAAEGIRIMVTTRSLNIAKLTATKLIVPHELQGLSEHESLLLFEKMAFGEGVEPSQRYVEIGKKILRKCYGVPLVVRTMGGLLSSKETESEWKAISEEQLLSLGREDSDILATLKLSYDNLPSNLKRCFAYSSLFPKDYKIDVKTLVQLWMAQGYITKSSQSSLLEDVGVEYFKNLLWRSFFQEVTKDDDGNMESCKMHDLMHDLAVAVAGEEIKCLSVDSTGSGSLLNVGDVNLERIRHISIDLQDRNRWWSDIAWEAPALLAKATRLRTLLILKNCSRGAELDRSCGRIFSEMTRLRVFGLGGAKIEISSFVFYKLKHLRYLDLSSNEMETLPNEMTRLVNLQVLDLNFCQRLWLLPVGLGKLSNLVYLDLYGCSDLSCIPAGIENLSLLREFPFFILAKAAADSSRETAACLGELKSLDNLNGRLVITNLEWVKDKSDAEAANLKEKSQLRTLELFWSPANNYNMAARRGCDHERSILEGLQPHPNLKRILMQFYGGSSIPTTSGWFSSLRNLVEIGLFYCGKLQSLPSLAPLVFLQALKLYGLDSLEHVQSETVASSSPSSNNDLQFLPSLESLSIEECRNLIGWSARDTEDKSPPLPRVSTLKIGGCPKMVSVPRFLVNFDEVELKDVSSELLGAFGASLVSPSAHPRFEQLSLECAKDFPQGSTLNLTSLVMLCISHCDDMTTLSPSILRHLSSLQELQIQYCKILELEDGDGDDVSPQQVLPSLRILTVRKVPKLVALPKWFQHSSNLQQLELYGCDNLKFLPNWLTELTALETLTLPYHGYISSRCRNSTGEDWPNISHIPNIEVDGKYVQQGGRYLGTFEEEEEEDSEEGGDIGGEEVEAEQQQQQQQQGASWHIQISRLSENCFARITCNLFEKCFLP
ncbi:unnamed protein product [Linum tenue]|uniref:Disease resistance protein RGA3 n=1 Tax=Linum tenue TaxID=586396 RepID=A0AAV0KAR3_9ROSI|nr:unnamed protein product [Linum tenue]